MEWEARLFVMMSYGCVSCVSARGEINIYRLLTRPRQVVVSPAQVHPGGVKQFIFESINAKEAADKFRAVVLCILRVYLISPFFFLLARVV